jgi:hypothetical protein
MGGRRPYGLLALWVPLMVMAAAPTTAPDLPLPDIGVRFIKSA